MTYPYDPEEWELSTIRAVQDWATTGLNSGLYEVVMEFPAPAIEAKTMPFTKAMVHFEVDAIEIAPVGIGENVFALNYDPVGKTVTPQFSEVAVINFDVGIWTSDRTGGTTTRARLRQYLQELFGVGSRVKFRKATDGGDGGIEILSFSGGRNSPDTIGDVPVYRTVNSELEVRVFTRTKIDSDNTGPSIETIVQAPGLTILG